MKGIVLPVSSGDAATAASDAGYAVANNMEAGAHFMFSQGRYFALAKNGYALPNFAIWQRVIQEQEVAHA